MRRLVIAATLAASLAPLAAVDASAASALATPRTYTLACEITRVNFANYFRIRNTTAQSIPLGTRISVAFVVAAAGKTIGVRKSVSARPTLGPGQSHAYFGTPTGATSCSATVQLIPDYYRR